MWKKLGVCQKCKENQYDMNLERKVDSNVG